MNVLGLDSATAVASVGLVSDGVSTVERRRPMVASHARSLLLLIDEVLNAAGVCLADLDRLAVSIGPGSFTGLRVGLATIKGLALGSGLQVVGVPTLAAYAVALGPRPGLVWPVLDARKGEVYVASYRWHGDEIEEVMPPSALTPDALATRFRAPCALVGDGVEAYGASWPSEAGMTHIPLACLAPSGAVVARLGATRGPTPLDVLEPHYCRRSEAEVHRHGVVATTLSSR